MSSLRINYFTFKMNIDKELAVQATSYIYMPNNEIISFHFSNNESKMKDKDYIQDEFLNQSDIIIVPGDSNCLIHSVLVSLYQKDFNNFINIITTLCSEYELPINENLILYNPNIPMYFNDNNAFFGLFAQHAIRQCIRNKWSFNNSEHEYHKNPDYHMNNYAIDGLARNMVCKIFGIPKLIIYQAYDDESRKKGIYEIKPDNIPQDTTNKTYFYNFVNYNIEVFSIDSKHYDSIVR